MLKYCLSFLLMGIFSLVSVDLSAQPYNPRCVEQGRVLQRFHAGGSTRCEQQQPCGCCGLFNVEALGVQCSADLCPLNVYVGPSCNSCYTPCGQQSSSPCARACQPCRQCGCCPCRPIFIRPRPGCGPCCGVAACPSCKRAPIYDESDQEDVYIPEHNAYWPTKKTDSWMRELQW